MARGFETGSDNEKIDELQRQLDDVIDSQIFSVDGNANLSIDSSRGARNSASGDAGGVRSNEPIIHKITDVNEAGASTGVFDRINIISSMAIIDHTSTPITLKYIQGPVKDGARIRITPKNGKIISVVAGGNILTADPIEINDDQYYELVKYSQAETGVTGGAWKILLSGSGSGGISEPIILGINTLTPQTSPTVTSIAWNTKNPQHITIDRNITFSFTDLPAVGSYEGILVIIDIDGTGGYASPIWPASLLNPPVIPTNPNTRFSVMLYTINGGTVVTHATSTGSGNTSVTNEISQGNSFVRVTDVGTGSVITHVDGVQKYSIQATRADFAVANIFGLRILNFDATLGASTITPSTSGVVWNFPDNTNKFSIDFAGNNGIAVSKDNVIIFSGTPGNVSAALRLYRNETVGVPAIGDAVGTVHFDGNNTIDALQEYALINGGIRGVTLGSEEGSLVFQVVKAGTMTDIINVDSGETIIKNLLNMNNNKISNVVDPTANQDAATKIYVDNATGIQNQILQGNSSVTVTDTGVGNVSTAIDGTIRFQVQPTVATFTGVDIAGLQKLTFVLGTISITPSANDLVINFPTGIDGLDIKFNGIVGTSIARDRVQIQSGFPNANAVSLHMFRDDPTPTIDDILGEVQFRGRDSVAANIVYGKIGVEIENTIAATSEGSFQWTLRKSGILQEMMSLKDGVLGISRHLPTSALSGAALVLARTDTGAAIGDEAGEISFNINSGVEIPYGSIGVIWDNTTSGDNSSRMDFQLLTDDALQNILTLRGSAITDNKIAMEIGAGSFIKPKSGVMGYFVNNALSITGSIGTLGSNQIPVSSDNSNPPTKADLNGLFGNFVGCMGMYGLGTNRSLYAKTELGGGDWARFEVTSYITV